MPHGPCMKQERLISSAFCAGEQPGIAQGLMQELELQTRYSVGVHLRVKEASRLKGFGFGTGCLEQVYRTTRLEAFMYRTKEQRGQKLKSARACSGRHLGILSRGLRASRGVRTTSNISSTNPETLKP